MDVGGTGTRMADYLRDQQEKVISRWSELVVAGVRGRTSLDEVRRELGDLYSLVIRMLADADDHAAGELRAALDELSRSRARTASPPARPPSGCSPSRKPSTSSSRTSRTWCPSSSRSPG